MNIYDIESVKLLLSKQLKISIIPHKNPDGDAIGSCLGLYHYLKLHEHDVTVVSPNDFPEGLKWMPEAENIVIYDVEPEKGDQTNRKITIDFHFRFQRIKPSGCTNASIGKIKSRFCDD